MFGSEQRLTSAPTLVGVHPLIFFANNLTRDRFPPSERRALLSEQFH